MEPPPFDDSKEVPLKDRIVALYLYGIAEIEDLAMLTGSRASYVGAVLQEEVLEPGYFDLYTSTRHPMNVYSKFFAGKLGFKDVRTAENSVALIDRLHRQFALDGDRAGQHQALVMALTMFNRARWTGKEDEAQIFRRWLADRMAEAEVK
jgi:hypothetical protein